MNTDDKDNAIADAEKAGLYYSNNSEKGYTREIKEDEKYFLIAMENQSKARENSKELKK